MQQEFLSTPSARRATIAPPPLRGVPDISIHALREEGDGILPDLKGTTSEFLSTPSARRATLVRSASSAGERISIHALREEGDEKWYDTGGRMT